MSVFTFLQSVGEQIAGIGNNTQPPADALKKSLDSHNLGTGDVQVQAQGNTVVLSGTVKDQAAYEKAVLAVGNVEGISGVNADQLKVASNDAARPVFYTVKKGDTLWKIAEEQYGKGQGAKNILIFEANKPMLNSPDKIYPGQMLRIPPLS